MDKKPTIWELIGKLTEIYQEELAKMTPQERFFLQWYQNILIYGK